MKKKTYNIIFIALLSVIISISCQTDRSPNRTTSKKEPVVNIKKEVDINQVNFYFENSASMNGYLGGDNFRQSIGKVLLEIKNENLHSYFVNTKEYKVNKILDKIRSGVSQIKTKGTGNSDHKFIFTNAIKNSSNNNLSIVITDGIYSMKGGNIADVEVDIQDAFEDALEINEIETVVFKMTSNFKGTYYSETCKSGHKAIKINQARPYYLFLFGSKDIINKTLEKIVIKDDLKGLEEESRFIITKDLKVNYTVLTQGEEKKGSFRQIRGHNKGNSIVKEIGEAEKLSKRGVLLKDRYLQFGIGLDYSNSSIPESYLLNTTNYSIEDNTGYKIKEIKKVSDLNKAGQTYKFIDGLNKKGASKYTHVIVVQAKTKLYGDLKISLDINFPKWIKETGTVDDCSIKKDTSTTFAFDRLMTGVSKAYQKVSNKKEFFNIQIKIKAN